MMSISELTLLLLCCVVAVSLVGATIFLMYVEEKVGLWAALLLLGPIVYVVITAGGYVVRYVG